MSDIAEVRLWFLLQQSLDDAEACSKLKPLKMSNSKMTDVATLGHLLDVGTSQADENIIEAAHLSQDAEGPITSLDQMLRPKDVRNKPQDSIDDLLDDGSVLEEECLDNLDDGGDNTFSRHQKETNTFFSSLEDEAYQFLGEDDADDDLFWSDLDDDEDLLAETHSLSWASHNIIHTSRNDDELLNGAQKESYDNHDSFEDLEGPWPDDADILFEEGELLKAS